VSGADTHNALYYALLTLGGRYHVTVDIGGPFDVNSPAHTEEHNRIGRAMLALRDAANAAPVTPAVVLTLPDVALVGDTGHVTDHATLATALTVLQAVVLPWE
jgi:hypothetical protein